MSQAGMLAFPFGEYRVTEQVLLAQCQREVYAGSERIEQFTDRTGSGYERLLYVHEDLQGNTRYYTKDNGQSFAELTYDAWGMPESPNKLLNNDHGNYVYATYTGHIFDTTLDIYFAEARFYDAQTRQWLAIDPIKSGNNWYQYCYSSPIVYFDPDGENPIVGSLVGNVAGTLWGGIVGLYEELTDDEAGISIKDVTYTAKRYGVNGFIIGGAIGTDPANATLGVGSQLASDVLDSFGEGKPKVSSPETYTGSVVGSFISGNVPGRLGAALGGATDTIVSDFLENSMTESEHTLKRTAQKAVYDAMVAFLIGDARAGQIANAAERNFGDEITAYLGNVILGGATSSTFDRIYNAIEPALGKAVDEMVIDMLSSFNNSFSSYNGGKLISME